MVVNVIKEHNEKKRDWEKNIQTIDREMSENKSSLPIIAPKA